MKYDACLVRELNNYLKFLITRGKIIQIAPLIMKTFSDKVTKSNQNKYPPYLLDMIPTDKLLEIENIDINKLKIRDRFDLGLTLTPEEFDDLENITIPLATRDVTISLKPSWNMNFEDQEDLFALHRFGWILRTLVKRPEIGTALFMWNLVLNWIENVSLSNKKAWESYSVSERIVNWIIFKSILYNSGVKQLEEEMVVLDSLLKQAIYLLHNLEYHGPDRTNNHLINNGRALYVVGSFFDIDFFKDVGRKILLEELFRMFTPSGFLNEGSSHYHFLLCRTYLEILFISKEIRDENFYQKLSERVTQMTKYVQFLWPKEIEELPLIGDASPDFPPDWLRGIDSVAKYLLENQYLNSTKFSKGWHSLWMTTKKAHNFEYEKPYYKYREPKESRFRECPDAGLYRFISPNYQILWHIAPESFKSSFSHGHNDIGGFQLYWCNKPIFVDTGRVTYTNTLIGRYGKSAVSHNTIMIDSYEPAIIPGLNYHQFIIKDYVKQYNMINYKDDDDLKMFQIKNKGYSRIHPSLKVIRSFILKSNEVMIKDEILGKGKHTIETYFHLHPDINIKKLGNNRFSLSLNSTNRLYFLYEMDNFESLDILRGVKGLQMAGWYSPAYGKIMPTVTIRFRQTGNIPVLNNFVIQQE